MHSTETHQHQAKILVCDDDQNVRLLTRQCLEAEGMAVVEASNGLEAIDKFVRERPDLVFLDVEMPGMTGLEACQRIREMPQGENIPIMIVTGSDDRKSIDQGFEAGATQYKTKPVNWSLLGRDVQYMLRASNAFNSLKRQEDRLRYLAYYDPLTSLPNRRSFNEQLNRILKRAQRHKKSAALLFIDLDHFKRINDSIGHARGDRLLVEIAKRLTMELREDDAVSYFSEKNALEDEEATRGTEIARLGGDEFTVVLSDVEDSGDIEKVARRILDSLSRPIALQSHNPVVTPSIGIAVYPQDGNDAETLVRNADTAMYVAKAEGRACYRFYDEEMNARAVEQLKMEEELRDAMRNHELELRYQPQIDCRTGEVVSMEALVRWKHPVRGMVSPVEFIPVAESTGQIIELGEWVMDEVARNCLYWDELGLKSFRVCVNISPLQFNQRNLPEWVAHFLDRSGLPPERLELELTESAIMTDAETNIARLRELKALGVDLAVDDFGTGYSSLSYLKRFPIDTLKIDQSFVSDLDTPDGAAIVDAILALAKTLNLRVIAEGIENERHLSYLVRNECDLLQGFFFSRPLYPEDVPTMLDENFSRQINKVVENQLKKVVDNWLAAGMKCRALLAILPALLYQQLSANEPEPQSLHVLLQGSAAATLAGLVKEHGGEVTHHLHLIDAVGARVDRQQLDAILDSGLVSHYLDDLGDVIQDDEEEPPCRVRGHIELQITPDTITWPLYNKMEAPATFESLELTWPVRLGRIERMELAGSPLDPKLYAGQEAGRVAMHFGERAPKIGSRADLAIRFSSPSAPPQDPLRQKDFKIEASFAEGCTTDLVPGYFNNHEDYYYNTVAGIDPLHLQGITGEGVTVAVVDSGLWEHPALMNDTRGEMRVLARYDAITDTLDREVLDESGHGTHMSSIIAHSGLTLRHGHHTGTWRGVAPDVRLVAVKILDRAGQAHLLDIVRAIQWVVDHRERYGIRVLNLSFAQRPRWHYWEDPVNQAVMRAWAAGIVVVAAAGNEGPEPMTIGSPANQPYVITVGAVTDSWTPETRDDDYIPDFSSRGPTPSGHVKPDIVALGGHMTGLIHPASDLATKQPEDILASGEFVSTGSSQAAALVSGIIALLLQLEPELSPDDIKCKLVSSAEPAINADGKLAYSPFQQGYGYVTASRAVTLGEAGCGNSEFDLEADIEGERHFFGPAEMDEEGNPRLPLVEPMIADEPSEEGLSESRRWGVKAHIERLGNGAREAFGIPGTPFDWQALYAAEKERIERLASEPPVPPQNTP